MRTREFLTTKVSQPVTMRVAGPTDRDAVARLAALDSQRVPAGELLVGEVGGEIRAAVPVAGGPAIADPFRLTGDVVALLRERAGQMAAARGGERRAAHGFRLARA
jgi:hypothetical protein